MPQYINIRDSLLRFAEYGDDGRKLGDWIGDMLVPGATIRLTPNANTLLNAMVAEYVMQPQSQRTNLRKFQEARAIATWLNTLAQ